MRYGRAIKPQHSTNRRDSCVLSGILFLDLRSALMFSDARAFWICNVSEQCVKIDVTCCCHKSKNNLGQIIGNMIQARKRCQTIIWKQVSISKKHNLFSFISASLLIVLLASMPSHGYVCVQPITFKSRVTLELLVRLVSPNRSHGTTLSCCFPASSSHGVNDLLFRTKTSTGTSLRSSMDEDDTKDTPVKEKLNTFLRKLKWPSHHGELRLSPKRFLASVRQLKGNTKAPTALMDPTATVEKEVTGNAVTEQVLVQKEDPNGPRWAISASHTDLSGVWKPVVTTQFKKEYDEYLQNCGEKFVFRKVVVNAIGLQREHIIQKQQGHELEICATNPAGSWNRTLVASGADVGQDIFEPVNASIVDPDGDLVQVEAWWEQGGTVHRSWLRGKPRLYGGAFETVRYLESEDVLICNSTFHPSPDASTSRFKYAHVVWKFHRGE